MQKLISYAQNFEDIMLWRALRDVQDGCYVDVGAQSPDTDSVSRLFHEHGWRGVHVEPTPGYANLLRERRSDEVVLQVAVSDKPGILRFFDIAQSGLSTTDAAIAAEHRKAGFEVREIQVPAVTLDTVLDQIAGRDVHWLKIDVEGAELQVVQGWQHSAVRPWILVIESTRPLSPEQTHQEWEPAVLAKGYHFAWFDGLNRFYVSDAHPELMAAFQCGPNVFDDFALSAASMFCAEVNIAYRDMQSHMQGMIEERDALVAGQEAQIVLDREQLAARDEEMERLKLDHTLAINAMVQAQHRTLNEHSRMIEHATSQAAAELASVQELLAAEREESHRWWREAEQLRAHVQIMEASRSWQITRPLRAIRRRMSGGVLASSKRLMRPVAVGALRVVFGMPGVKAVLKPVLVRIPFIYNRLHAIASAEQLFDAARAQQPPIGGRERDHATVHLDRHAQQVLADLRAACSTSQEGAR